MTETRIWRELFAELRETVKAQLDPAHFDVCFWRRQARGEVRNEAQILLLHIAEYGAQSGTDRERLAWYMAAYAVYPLHGAPLDALAVLLIHHMHQAVIRDLYWATPVLDALQERCPNTRTLQSQAREAIAQLLQQAPATSPSARRRVDHITARLDFLTRMSIARNID